MRSLNMHYKLHTECLSHARDTESQEKQKETERNSKTPEREAKMHTLTARHVEEIRDTRR